ncbi:MAG: YcaO-like family protein [Pseudoclavibacter sp.]
MTRLAVHALSDDALLVSGDDGGRWVLVAGRAAILRPEVRAALSALRARGPDAVVPPPSDDETAIACVDELQVLAAAVDRQVAVRRSVGAGSPGGTAPPIGAPPQPAAVTVRWTFAGTVYRTTLVPGAATASADRIVACMRATVADPAHAAALVRVPVLDEFGGAVGMPRWWSDDSTEAEADPDVDADHPAGSVGVLERFEGGAWVAHPVDPQPLVDPITGLLRRIVERPAEPGAPEGFVHLHAELPHLASVDPTFQPDALAPAGTFRSSSLPPRRAAERSGIAHLCGAYLGQGRRRLASVDDLRRAGERVLTVAEWRPHDPVLHDAPGFPFVRDDPGLRTWLLRGSDARSGETCWAPLSLVHAGYLSSGLDHLRPTNGHNLAGLQAGTTDDEAFDAAAAHLISHDAVARWWRDGGRLREVAVPPAVAESWGGCAWRVRVLAVPTPIGVPVRLAVVDDREDDVIALGHACASSPDVAAERAVAEALVQHASARDLARADSLIRRAESLGNGGVAGLAPYDAERAYDTWFADRRRMIDPMCHVQRGLDPCVVAHTRARVEPDDATGTRGDAVTVDAPAASGPLSPGEALLRGTSRVVRVDVTTSGVREAGMRAVRALAPGLDRLGVAAFATGPDVEHPYPGW